VSSDGHNPLAAVIEVLAGALIRAAEESALDAPSYDVETSVFTGCGDSSASVGHVDSVRDAPDRDHRKNTYFGLG